MSNSNLNSEIIQLNFMENQECVTPDPAIGGGSDMSDGIMDIIRPSITKLDEQVKNTRKSQLLLSSHINQVSIFLKEITDEQSMPYDLDVYVRKLDESRKRIFNVSAKLQTIHDRMSQLQRNIARETFKQKQNLKQENQNLNIQ